MVTVYSTLRTTTHLHTYYVTSHISFKILQDIVTNVTPLDYVGIGIVSERVVDWPSHIHTFSLHHEASY